MKLKSLLIPATLAFASLASVASAANVAVNYSDIILGFRSTSVTAQNLEVNLGSVSQFTQTAAGSSFVVANLNVADLVTVYGSGWYASSTIFGLIGTTGKTGGGAIGPDGQALSTVWASNDSGTAYTTVNSFTNNNAVSKVLLMTNGTTQASGALNFQDSSLMSNVYTANISTAGTASWSKAGGTTGTSFVNYNRAAFESSLGGGTSTTTSLYELLPVAGNPAGLIGTFTLTDAGVLSFTSSGLYAAAIPEPSTYALIGGSVMLGFVVLRRRFQAKA